MVRLASTRLHRPKKVGRADKWRRGDIYCDVDEWLLKDATSTSLTGARGPTHRSEIFHGVDCLPAQRITAHLVSERGGGARLGVDASRGRPSVIRYRPGYDILAWHEGWRAPPGPTSRMTDARTEPRGGPRAASRPLQFSAIHPRRRRHPRDTCRRHLACFFTRRSDTEKRRSRPRGFTRPPPQTGRPSIPTKGTARTRSSGNESTRRLEPPSR